ncbi:TonB-dependent receptor [Novosphingobium sp.]|uniref:TonB-dependent receptor n=1 Tax=Novosphingobium sp. TaxID=1874826 RepID=UPI002B473EF6|nr:TonB-dependent receptor [Novosphingobium sp.]HKR93551.1 TonB-dependent receptor [Novosphingobium sp.]
MESAKKAVCYASLLPLLHIIAATPAAATEANEGALPAAGEVSQGESINDITVTAQKRETRLQKTPASINAVTQSTLENSAVYGLNDLAKVVPGLVITDNGPGQRRIALRGIRSPGEPQVAIYYDEAPLAGAPGTTSDSGGNQGDLQLFDVERVEVLRGPQGTLYGASSMGGAVRIIYRKPDERLSAGVDLIGSTTHYAGENYQVNAMVNVPIVDDRLAIRAVYFRRKNAGWIDNPGLGNESINREETEGARLLLRAKPTDWLTLDFGFHYYDATGANPVWAPGSGKFISASLAKLNFEDKNRLYTGTANADLGFADLIVTGSYQDRDSSFRRDPNHFLLTAFNNPAFCRRHFTAATCATPQGMQNFNAYVDSVTPLAYVSPQTMKNGSGEVRLQSKDAGLLSWTVGAYWSLRTSWVGSSGILVDASGDLREDAPLDFKRRVRDRLRQVAGFGEVSVRPLDGLTVTGGIRYYDYRRTVAGEIMKGFDLINFAVQPWTVRGTKENGLLYKANVAYQLSPEVLVYAQAASGFRPGGANQVIGLPSSFTPYQSDKLWTYEAGAKTTLLNGRLLFNLTGYVTDWKNLQVTGNSGTFLFLTNAGNAKVKGVEIETVALPFRGLQLSANVNLLSAKLTSDQINDLVIASGRKGDRIPQIANTGFSVAAQYEWDLGGLRALVRSDLSYVGPSYGDFRPDSPSYRRMGDYADVGARIGVSKDNWAAYIFATNLFDVRGRTTAGVAVGSNVEEVTTISPRTIGVNLKFGI